MFDKVQNTSLHPSYCCIYGESSSYRIRFAKLDQKITQNKFPPSFNNKEKFAVLDISNYMVCVRKGRTLDNKVNYLKILKN